MARKTDNDSDPFEPTPEELHHIEQIQGIAECLGMAFFETIRCAVYNAHNPRPIATNTKADRLCRDTGNLREAWRNLAGKIIEFAKED